MPVEACTPVHHPASGICVGPSATFPGQHADISEAPALHLKQCAPCFGTMLQCWRTGCRAAVQPIGERVEAAAARVLPGMSRRLLPAERKEARQAVVAKLIFKMTTEPKWLPDSVAQLDDPDPYLLKAVANTYRKWVVRNIKDGREDVTDGDVLERIESALTMSGRLGHHTLSSDPVGDRVTDDLRHVVVSAAGEARIKDVFATLRELLGAKRYERDAPRFAGFLRYLASGEDARPSLTQYSDRIGVSKATMSRAYNSVLEGLLASVPGDPNLDEDLRDLTLTFLHRLQAMTDMPDEIRTS